MIANTFYVYSSKHAFSYSKSKTRSSSCVLHHYCHTSISTNQKYDEKELLKISITRLLITCCYGKSSHNFLVQVVGFLKSKTVLQRKFLPHLLLVLRKLVGLRSVRVQENKNAVMQILLPFSAPFTFKV